MYQINIFPKIRICMIVTYSNEKYDNSLTLSFWPPHEDELLLKGIRHAYSLKEKISIDEILRHVSKTKFNNKYSGLECWNRISQIWVNLNLSVLLGCKDDIYVKEVKGHRIVYLTKHKRNSIDDRIPRSALSAPLGSLKRPFDFPSQPSGLCEVASETGTEDSDCGREPLTKKKRCSGIEKETNEEKSNKEEVENRNTNDSPLRLTEEQQIPDHTICVERHKKVHSPTSEQIEISNGDLINVYTAEEQMIILEYVRHNLSNRQIKWKDFNHPSRTMRQCREYFRRVWSNRLNKSYLFWKPGSIKIIVQSRFLTITREEDLPSDSYKVTLILPTQEPYVLKPAYVPKLRS